MRAGMRRKRHRNECRSPFSSNEPTRVFDRKMERPSTMLGAGLSEVEGRRPRQALFEQGITRVRRAFDPPSDIFPAS